MSCPFRPRPQRVVARRGAPTSAQSHEVEICAALNAAGELRRDLCSSTYHGVTSRRLWSARPHLAGLYPARGRRGVVPGRRAHEGLGDAQMSRNTFSLRRRACPHPPPYEDVGAAATHLPWLRASMVRAYSWEQRATEGEMTLIPIPEATTIAGQRVAGVGCRSREWPVPPSSPPRVRRRGEYALVYDGCDYIG